MDTTKYMIHTSKKNKYLPFKEAKQFAIRLKLKNIREWKEYVQSGKKPENIPSYPDTNYKEQGWAGWKEFLGNEYLSYEVVKMLARQLNIKSYKEWRRYVESGQKPKEIPATPDKIYKEWIDWGTFFGTGNKYPAKNTFRSFREARKFARTLKLKGMREWRQYTNSNEKPDDIPVSPDSYYAKWTSWGDFLGTGNISPAKMNYPSYAQLKIFAQKLKLKNANEWKAYCHSVNKPYCPDNLPCYPNDVYENKGWRGWGDFLGTGRIANQNREFLSFPKARTFARKLKLKSMSQWQKYCHYGKRPMDIPSNPYITYKNKGWTNWGDFLGNKK